MNIRKQDALRQMENDENNHGKRKIFSIKFVTKQGEVVYLPYAYSSGLKASMRANRLRGVTPCTAGGQRTGHPYPVCIDNILQFNNQTVMP